MFLWYIHTYIIHIQTLIYFIFVNCRFPIEYITKPGSSIICIRHSTWHRHSADSDISKCTMTCSPSILSKHVWFNHQSHKILWQTNRCSIEEERCNKIIRLGTYSMATIHKKLSLFISLLGHLKKKRKKEEICTSSNLFSV